MLIKNAKALLLEKYQNCKSYFKTTSIPNEAGILLNLEIFISQWKLGLSCTIDASTNGLNIPNIYKKVHNSPTSNNADLLLLWFSASFVKLRGLPIELQQKERSEQAQNSQVPPGVFE